MCADTASTRTEMITISDLFSTPLIEAQMPDHQPVCDALGRLFLEKEQQGDEYKYHKRRATQFGPLFESKFDLFRWPDAPVKKVAHFCHSALAEVMRRTTSFFITFTVRAHVGSFSLMLGRSLGSGTSASGAGAWHLRGGRRLL